MVRQIFDIAVAAEVTAREIYTEFMKLFRHAPLAVDLWRNMADDERMHEKTLLEIFDSLTEEEKSSRKEDDLFEKAERFVNGISMAEIIRDTLTLDDAYEFAYNLEYSEVNALMRFILADFVTSEIRRDFIMSDVNRHVAKLDEFSKSVCNAACRGAVKAIN